MVRGARLMELHDKMIEDLKEYDFTEDWKNIDKNLEIYQEYKNLNPLKKYFIYKMSSSSNKPLEKYKKALNFWDRTREKFAEKKKNNTYRYYCIDPDTYSELLQEIYKVLWDENILKLCRDDDNRIHGDTMNSITTTMSKYFRFLYEYDYYKTPLFTDEKGLPLKGSLPQSLEIFESEDETIKTEEKVLEFLRANHTLGNFIPVPFENGGGSFNVPRSKTTNDYWDWTLKYIFGWYEKNKTNDAETIIQNIDNKCDCQDNASLCELLGASCANVKLCVKWLCQFKENNNPSWDNFVSKNYLDPFVNKEQNGKYGEPKELWKGHFEQQLPGNQEDCEAYFASVTDMVNERSDLMCKALVT